MKHWCEMEFGEINSTGTLVNYFVTLKLTLTIKLFYLKNLHNTDITSPRFADPPSFP